MEKNIIYSDGSCLGNPGAGGWASLLLTQRERYLLCGGDGMTTNNRMELMGAIYGLEFLIEKYKKIQDRTIIFSDSLYLCKGASLWIHGWKKSNWKNGAIKNIDLWKRLDNAMSLFVNCLDWVWVKAHHEDKSNIFVDCVATSEASFIKDLNKNIKI